MSIMSTQSTHIHTHTHTHTHTERQREIERDRDRERERERERVCLKSDNISTFGALIFYYIQWEG